MEQKKDHPLTVWRRDNGNRSLQWLAEKVGCSQPHLSEIENGKNTPSLGLAARLCRVTGLEIMAFVRSARRIRKGK